MTLQITGFSGSLRKQSLNRSVLKYMDKQFDEIQMVELNAIPLFNADVEAEGEPESVFALKKAIKEADGLLIVTPEYSHSMPGILKNALDWAGSMTYENVLDGKPVMIAGASPSGMGTGFAQQHLRQVLAACNAWVMPQPQVYIGGADAKMTNGVLTDEATTEFLTDAFASFKTFIESVDQ